MLDETARAKTALYAAIFLTFIGYTGRMTGLEPVNSQFFAWAAWTYVLLADNLVFRLGGASPLVSRPAELLALAAWSVAFTSLLELLNLRLQGWHYVYQPASLSLRWTGRLFAWASFLPSLFITAELLRCLGLFRRLKLPPLKVPRPLPGLLLAAGLLLLALPLALPAFGPLAPLSLFLLADPLSYRLGLPSLLREWEGGLPGKTLRLAAAGLVCAPLWNAWNAAAGARWEYAAAGRGREVLGLAPRAYAAFALLALGAYSFYALASWLRSGRTWEETAWEPPGAKPPAWAAGAGWAFIIITSYTAFRLTDSYLVKLYVGWL